MITEQLPIPTSEQSLVGRRVFLDLYSTVQSHHAWFTEGIPQEWVRALDTIQEELTKAKRHAARAVKTAHTPAQADTLPLFPELEKGED